MCQVAHTLSRVRTLQWQWQQLQRPCELGHSLCQAMCQGAVANPSSTECVVPILQACVRCSL